MTTKISFVEYKKRKRPEQICINCGKHKEIYTHLNGDEDKPLCNTCNMQMRRNSPGAIQVKLLKLCATAIGAVEAMIGLPVEERQKKSLQEMQDELKLMVRDWLGDPQADEEANAPKPKEQVSGLPTNPLTDEFSEERKLAVSKESDRSFEASKNVPAGRKTRKALIASKVEQRKAAKAKDAEDGGANPMDTPNNPADDPAYQEYLEAPLA